MKRLLLVVLTAATLSVPAASYAEAPRGTDPSTFPRGDDPAVTWLGGATVHTAKGRTFGLPIPRSDEGVTRLLGRSRHSWVVAVLGGPYVSSTKVLRIHHARYRTVLTVESYYDRPTYLLSRHGQQLVTVDYDRGGSVVTAYDLDGHELGHLDFGLGVQPLDAVGDDVYLGWRRVVRWHPGRPPVRSELAAAFVDTSLDVQFAGDRHGVGPTSVTDPGTPAWTTKAFAPRAVSPDGRWVAGYTQDSIYRKFRRLEVRSMADGSVQPTTGLLLQPNAALAWDDADHLLAGVHGERGNALVRCGVDGVCERATDWLPGQAISFAHQPEYFFDWP